ncbi:MAG: hypothetical protein WCT28_04500 [Patescibacteria group bacterium]|jgi:hypothetical protein
MQTNKEYALLCEFATQSTNGLNSFMHVFDRTTFPANEAVTLRGFLAVRLTHLPESPNLEVYVTDGSNTLVDKGSMFKQMIKGPNANLLVRIGGMAMPKPGEYRVWARIDGAEPLELCTWYAEVKSPAAVA